MTPVNCQTTHDPDADSTGDCYRACLASLLDLPAEAVPHFYAAGVSPEAAAAHSDRWLAERGLVTFQILYPEATIVDLLDDMDYLNEGKLYMLTGTSSFGNHHVVICSGGKIIHDPSGSGIVAPCKDGAYRVTVLAKI